MRCLSNCLCNYSWIAWNCCGSLNNNRICKNFRNIGRIILNIFDCNERCISSLVFDDQNFVNVENNRIEDVNSESIDVYLTDIGNIVTGWNIIDPVVELW